MANDDIPATDCIECAGGGLCPHCEGEADGVNATCEWCDDTGACPACGGSGTREVPIGRG